MMKLCKKYLRASRNITGHNFFSSIPLINNLLNSKTTYVGTVRATIEISLLNAYNFAAIREEIGRIITV